MNPRWLLIAVVLVSLACRVSAQDPAPWHDPSPHSIQYVTVDENVKLEVLDWGGTGRPLVLLAGLGASAHMFDDFAPKLTSKYHVYGITRRGSGFSSVPTSGYSADRLGVDVLAVLDALKLDRPVLVGHSIAGEELSSVGSRHPERIAGLIYLDAAYAFAYYDRSQGNLNLDLHDLQKKLEQLEAGKGPPDQKPLLQDLLKENLPQFEKDLQRQQESLQGPSPAWPSPSAADRESFLAAVTWFKSIYGYAMPEAELRQEAEFTAGHVAGNRTKPVITQAIIAGEQKYTDIRVPVLAIFAVPENKGPFTMSDPAARAAYEARELASREVQVKAFETGVPSAHVVRLAHASHDVFLSNEADVLREMNAFLKTLP